MSERRIFMISGPTLVDPRVLRAMSYQAWDVLDAEFKEKLFRSLNNLKAIGKGEADAFILPGTGTLAQELSLQNCMKPGYRVLNIITGFFSRRFGEMAIALGGKCEKLEAPFGETITPDQVRNVLKKSKFDVITCSHVDTYASVALRLKEICEVIRDYGDGAINIVDTVCSLGGTDVRTEEWGIDFNCSASQKALGCPAGLTLLLTSKRASEMIEKREGPISCFYGDLKGWLPVVRGTSNYWATPPVNLIYAIDEGFKLVLEEGLERRFRRHAMFSKAVRSALTAMNLKLVVAKDEDAAHTITNAYYPEGIDDLEFRKYLKSHFGILIQGVFGEEYTFRFGHMGNATVTDVISTVAALEKTMQKFNHRFEYGKALKTAIDILDTL